MNDDVTRTAEERSAFWVEEDQHEVLRMRYRMVRSLHAAESALQRVEILESAGFGRMLVNDGTVMLSERDERIYHEMIVHVPMFVSPSAKRVLVIGGGDGGTARELLMSRMLPGRPAQWSRFFGHP